jgi:hypothetical protein
LLGELPRDLKTDAPVGPGNDRDPSIKQRHDRLHLGAC